MARDLDDPARLFWAVCFDRLNSLQAGDFERGRQQLDVMTQLSDELREPVMLWVSAYHQASEALLLGDSAHAEELATRALELGTSSRATRRLWVLWSPADGDEVPAGTSRRARVTHLRRGRTKSRSCGISGRRGVGPHRGGQRRGGVGPARAGVGRRVRRHPPRRDAAGRGGHLRQGHHQARCLGAGRAPVGVPRPVPRSTRLSGRERARSGLLLSGRSVGRPRPGRSGGDVLRRGPGDEHAGPDEVRPGADPARLGSNAPGETRRLATATGTRALLEQARATASVHGYGAVERRALRALQQPQRHENVSGSQA